jgi:hypothetical protein
MAFNPSMPFGHPGFGGLPSRWFGGGNPTSVSQMNYPVNQGGKPMGGMGMGDRTMGTRFSPGMNPMPQGQMGVPMQTPMPAQGGGFTGGPTGGNSQLAWMVPGTNVGGVGAAPAQPPPTNVSQMMQQLQQPQGLGAMNPQPFPQGMPGASQMPQQAQGSPLMQALMQARMQPLR